jgi:NAD(P)-dependent dehydrogenase (short-subunit alcohol dehydrogenase family)
LNVVVTGTSTGIGRATAMYLVRRGFRVFAGIRRREDGETLQKEGGANIVPIELDVTSADAIAAAAREVGAMLDGQGLDGLVNNAGIGISGPMEYVSMNDVRHHFDVDVFGPIAVTQAFLPQLRLAGGRVVNIGSVGGHIAIPFGGVLSACKSALGALSDAWRLELHPFGIHVVVVEPGAIYTPAVEKTLGDVEGVVRTLPPEGVARYERLLRSFNRVAYERERNGSPPEVVAEVVHRALVQRRPRIRYRVGKDARLLTMLARLLPDRALDLVRMRVFTLPAAFGVLTTMQRRRETAMPGS